MPERRLHTDVWASPELDGLSAMEFVVLFRIKFGPEMPPFGAVQIPASRIAGERGYEATDVADAIDALVARGLLERIGLFVYVPSFIHETANSPKIFAAIANRLVTEDLPDELRSRIVEATAAQQCRHVAKQARVAAHQAAKKAGFDRDAQGVSSTDTQSRPTDLNPSDTPSIPPGYPIDGDAIDPSSYREGEGEGEAEKQRLTPLAAPRDTEGGSVARRIFDSWIEATGRTSRTVFDSKRRSLIAARIREGFGEEDLIDAVRGWRRSPWHVEKGANDLGLLLRDAAHAERFRDLERDGSGVASGKRPITSVNDGDPTIGVPATSMASAEDDFEDVAEREGLFEAYRRQRHQAVEHGVA